MGFLHFPPDLTAEEKSLQQKYNKLKRKKKQLTDLNKPKEASTPPPIPVPAKKAETTLSKADSKERAKRLLKMGKIASIKVAEKKSEGFVRKRSSAKLSNTPAGFHPFSASSEGESNAYPPYDHLSSIGPVNPREAESLAREETFREKRREGKAHYVNRDLPNQGNTVYVRFISGLNESKLKEAFSPHGNICHVTLELEKDCAFITFESIDEANRAIDSMNGEKIGDNIVRVSLARKQPHVPRNSLNDNPISLTPSTVSTGNVSNSTTSASRTNQTKNSWTSIASAYRGDKRPAASNGARDAKLIRRQVTYEDSLYE